MTETSVTFPPGRYGRRREPRRALPRWVVAVLVVVVALAGTFAAARLHQQYGAGRAFDATVLRFYDVTDEQVVVEFTVVVPAGETAVCAVRARAEHGGEVGREQVEVTPEGDNTRPVVVHRLATSERPTTGEVQRCWRAP